MDVRVIDPQEDSELVRRLATGLVVCWDAIPAGIQADILREATLSSDPASKRSQLEQQLSAFIKKLQKSLA
jgi:hypothetical protein